MLDGGLSGGTGQKLTHATVIVAGVCSLVASLLSVVSVHSPTSLVLRLHANCPCLKVGMASNVREICSGNVSKQLRTPLGRITENPYYRDMLYG
jgi:hypothetical protein